MAKLDLVMWTYNSASTLDRCLSSIDASIPQDSVCHKIAVDGGSKDRTPDILRDHSWSMVRSKPGISSQANKALSLVDTENYASFEHDIMIRPGWLERLLPLLGPREVAAVQGFKIVKGSKVLERMDAGQKHGYYPPWANFSLDNTIYKTDQIRGLGGYPVGCPYSTDSLLRERVLQRGYRWLVDPNTIVFHYKPSYWQFLRHSLRALIQARTLWFVKRDMEMRLPKQILMVAMSPFSGARMAGEYHCASAFVAYPIMRYSRLLVREITRDKKRIGLISPS